MMEELRKSVVYQPVSEINKYIKMKLENDFFLQRVFIKGEISNFTAHRSGHLYFSVKDEKSKISAVMFKGSAMRLGFRPKEGMKVLIVGRVSLYEATGQYQVYVDEMKEDGLGDLHIAFEKLKEKLSKEGLFDKIHKKPIPKMPKRVGIVTAPTGAAIRDINSTIGRRFPICETILFPSLVQGKEAAQNIVEQIKKAQEFEIDVLIVGRGGGSIEDLWPFNEEIVARAIFESEVPIVSGVGHEIDFTISDFVADARAETPTGAAEMVVPNLVDLLSKIDQMKIRMTQSINKKIEISKKALHKLEDSYILKRPSTLYEMKAQKLDNLVSSLEAKINAKLDSCNKAYQHNLKALEVLNPIHVLSRGYSVVEKDGKVVKSVKNIKNGDELDIKMSDGMIKVQSIEYRE